MEYFVLFCKSYLIDENISLPSLKGKHSFDKYLILPLFVMFAEAFLYPNLMPVTVFILVLVTSWFWLTKSPKNFPPSPGLALPFIGHLYLMGRNPRQRFKEWNKTLGDIFSLKMGSKQVVVVNGLELIKETLAKKGDSFSGRPVDDFMNAHFPRRRNGIIFSSGAHWKAQRSIGLTILRNLGMGKNVLAEKISEELSFLLDEIILTKGTPVDPKALIYTSLSNVICSMIFGKRFDKKDEKFVKLIAMLDTFVHVFNGVTVINHWHFLKYVPFDLFQGKALINALRGLEEFSSEMVHEVSDKCDKNDPDNFILAYLDEMQKQKSMGQSTFLDTISLACCIDDLFAAGTETTSSTILWCILYAVHFSDIQEKVHREIVEQIGTNRSPSVNDRPVLKHLNAFIMETQRLSSIVPLNVPRLCMVDEIIGGFSIPKGTTIIPSLDSVLHDLRIWGDPQNFRPERFIDELGNLKTAEELIPFSIGKRVCIGESLAKMELFLYVANLFQKFQFTAVDANNLPPLVEVFGITAPPVHYQVKFVERKP